MRFAEILARNIIIFRHKVMGKKERFKTILTKRLIAAQYFCVEKYYVDY